jgi:nicotinate-nucleotide pyrophosphorylase (carboxylating)
MQLLSHHIEEVVSLALAEDLGRAGDITSMATVDAEAQCVAVMSIREAGVLAGLALAQAAFRQIDSTLMMHTELEDGRWCESNDIALTVTGSARSVLAAERVALNFMGHLSGIATLTRRFVEAVKPYSAHIVCTRKTTPNLRVFQKYAVRCGGGFNHRFGLDDAILIKDNHIAIAGGVTQALKAAKKAAGHLVKIEIEVDTLAQLDEALQEGVDVILLDNMSLDELAQAVRNCQGRAILEASGNMSLDRVNAVAATGVDLISVGALTHSVKNLDIGLDIKA